MAQIETATANFTRPNNTTAYSSGDVVSDGMAMNFGLIRGSLKRIIVSKSTNTTSNAPARLFLFAGDPGDKADNAALALANPNKSLLGEFTLSAYSVQAFDPTTATGSAGTPTAATTVLAYAMSDTPVASYPIDVANSNSDAVSGKEIYGYLVAAGAYSPGALEKFSVQLHVTTDAP